MTGQPSDWGPDFIQGARPPGFALAPAIAFQLAQDEHRTLSLSPQ